MAYVGILKSRFSEAATSSCVDSGLEAHSTASAPPSRSAIIKFAVSLVTCRQAETRKPLSGCSFTKRLRIDSSTGICWPAHSILRLPASASPMSFTSPFFSSAIANVLLLNFGFEPEGSNGSIPVKGAPATAYRAALVLKVRHPPQSGWLGEWGRLKGGCPVGLGVALKRAFVDEFRSCRYYHPRPLVRGCICELAPTRNPPWTLRIHGPRSARP